MFQGFVPTRRGLKLWIDLHKIGLARTVVCPNDDRYDSNNTDVISYYKYWVGGVPSDVTPTEISRGFREWGVTEDKPEGCRSVPHRSFAQRGIRTFIVGSAEPAHSDAAYVEGVPCLAAGSRSRHRRPAARAAVTGGAAPAPVGPAGPRPHAGH